MNAFKLILALIVATSLVSITACGEKTEDTAEEAAE